MNQLMQLNHIKVISKGVILVFFIMLSSCAGNQADTIEADLESTSDSLFSSDESEIIEGQVTEDVFFELFKFDFEHSYDFGWRFIEANYEGYETDSTREITPYDRENNLSEINSVVAVSDEVVPEVFPIHFEGYAHSHKRINGNHLFIAYRLGEIHEEFHYYYVDVKDNYEILKEGELAESGGDEGSWFHSYGEFSKDNSVYEINYVSGEGLDTNLCSINLIYFESNE